MWVSSQAFHAMRNVMDEQQQVEAVLKNQLEEPDDLRRRDGRRDKDKNRKTS